MDILNLATYSYCMIQETDTHAHGGLHIRTWFCYINLFFFSWIEMKLLLLLLLLLLL